jgi:hypothetical protein
MSKNSQKMTYSTLPLSSRKSLINWCGSRATQSALLNRLRITVDYGGITVTDYGDSAFNSITVTVHLIHAFDLYTDDMVGKQIT